MTLGELRDLLAEADRAEAAVQDWERRAPQHGSTVQHEHWERGVREAQDDLQRILNTELR